MTLRVTFLSTDLFHGGAEVQLVNLAIRLKAHGLEIYIISMLPPQAFTEELSAAGISVATLNMRRGVPDPRALFSMRTFLRKWRPHVLHSHMVHANLLARVSKLLHRVPALISTVHSINEGGRIREIAYRLTDALSDLTTIISKTAAEHYIRIGAVPKHKLRVIPNGVDTQHFSPNLIFRKILRKDLDLNGCFTWLAIGRFEVPKDYPNLLWAFDQVILQNPEAVLLIAGQGSLKYEMEALASQLRAKERVRFLGIRKDVRQLMNVADGYVMSSAWEGMPMVLLEAASSGLPIVATDVGGNREVVLHRKSGFLVPPRDPKALAKAMQRLMVMPEVERRRMGEIGRTNTVTNYSLERVVYIWEALYQELLKRKGII